MTLHRKQRLLTRAVAANLALVSIGLAVLTGMFAYYQHAAMQREMELRGQAVADFVAAQSQFPLLVGDKAELHRIAIGALTGEDVLYVQIEAASGGEVVRLNKSRPPGAKDSILEVCQPVTAMPGSLTEWDKPADSGRTLGAVRIGISTAKQAEAVIAMIQRAVRIALVGMIVMVAVQAWQLRRLLSPLKELTEFTRDVGEGDLTRRAPVHRLDEIGEMAQAFNRMLGRLGETTVSRDEMDNILRSMAESIVVLDRTGRIRMANEATLQLLGYAGAELIGEPWDLLLEGNPPPETGAEERAYRAKQGSRVAVLLSSAVLRDRHGDPQGSVWAAQDMRELKRVSEELKAAKDAAEEASRAKSTFIAHMSHELRTPLNAIIGYSELMQDEFRDRGLDDAVPDLERIRRAGCTLLAQVNDVLDLSKADAGRMTLRVDTFSLPDLLHNVVSNVEPMARAQNNRLVLTGVDEPALVTNDPIKLQQSLLNLLSNACKFTQDGEVSLAVQKPTIGEREWLQVCVRDTGIGIAPDELQKLFQPFVQADSSVTRKYGGTGLGLALTRKICRLMGGDVSVESAPGRGSAFTLLVPMHVVREET